MGGNRLLDIITYDSFKGNKKTCNYVKVYAIISGTMSMGSIKKLGGTADQLDEKLCMVTFS